jgi:hypothetical protein
MGAIKAPVLVMGFLEQATVAFDRCCEQGLSLAISV